MIHARRVLRSSWPKFDQELAGMLGLPENCGAVEVIRNLYLTDGDIIESLRAVYGEPVLKPTRNRPAAALSDTIMLAQWDSPGSSLTLLRGGYSAEFQLVLMSKALSARARDAIRESGRLDALDAPRRELEQRKKDVADADAARDKLRTTNKAAFRP